MDFAKRQRAYLRHFATAARTYFVEKRCRQRCSVNFTTVAYSITEGVAYGDHVVCCRYSILDVESHAFC